jgi:hypothetical protein
MNFEINLLQVKVKNSKLNLVFNKMSRQIPTTFKLQPTNLDNSSFI